TSNPLTPASLLWNSAQRSSLGGALSGGFGGSGTLPLIGTVQICEYESRLFGPAPVSAPPLTSGHFHSSEGFVLCVCQNCQPTRRARPRGRSCPGAGAG